MRGYLERIAAAAITPGGSFHPIAGSLYARRVEAPVSHMGSFPEDAPSESLETHITAQSEPPPSPFTRQLPVHNSEAPESQSPVRNPARSVTSESATYSEPEADPSPQPSVPLLQPSSDRQPQRKTFRPLVTPKDSATPQFSSQASPESRSGEEIPARTASALRDQAPTEALRPEPVTVSAPKPSATSGGLAGPQPMAHPSVPSPASRTATPSPLSVDEGATARVARPPATAASLPPPTPVAYQPLVADYALPFRPTTAGTTLQPKAEIPRVAAPRERPQPTPEQREPDEIQIHIGRIEVTALTPAPPTRTPPAAIRRTPSLDDYLRRGNGRG